MKTIIRPDLSLVLALFGVGLAALARFRATRSLHHADQIAALVAASGQPSGA